MGAVILKVLVVWNLHFCSNKTGAWEIREMKKELSGRTTAMEFIRTSPQLGELFECVDSNTNRSGFCFIENIWPQEVNNEKQGRE